MAKNTSFTLGAHYDDFVANQLASGRYNSASEVVRAGLRLLEENEVKFHALRQALQEGKDSPTAEEFSIDAINRELDAESQR